MNDLSFDSSDIEVSNSEPRFFLGRKTIKVDFDLYWLRRVLLSLSSEMLCLLSWVVHCNLVRIQAWGLWHVRWYLVFLAWKLSIIEGESSSWRCQSSGRISIDSNKEWLSGRYKGEWNSRSVNTKNSSTMEGYKRLWTARGGESIDSIRAEIWDVEEWGWTATGWCFCISRACDHRKSVWGCSRWLLVLDLAVASLSSDAIVVVKTIVELTTSKTIALDGPSYPSEILDAICWCSGSYKLGKVAYY